MKIQVLESAAEGMQRVYENEKWTVGIKNWKPASDVNGVNMFERHNKTDELFVLVNGKCTLVTAEEVNGEMKIEGIAMEPFKVYNIPQSLWHNAVMSKDAKMVLIEDVSTGMDNSDILDMTPAQIETVKSLVK